MKLKDEIRKFLQQFFIDFKELFKEWKVIDIQVLDQAMQVDSTQQKYNRFIER
jgi:hypothetical protein